MEPNDPAVEAGVGAGEVGPPPSKHCRRPHLWPYLQQPPLADAGHSYQPGSHLRFSSSQGKFIGSGERQQ